MDLPPLRQDTDATVHTSHALERDGSVQVLVVIKQRFAVTVKGVVTRVSGAEVRPADELWDEGKPEASSLKHSSDLCLRKPATDIVVSGEAMARDKQPHTELDVLVRVGALERALRVIGPRVWYKGGLGLVPTKPAPFTSVPLKWELAFGGRDASGAKLLEEPRNPVGVGIAADPATLVHKPLPNIEDPARLITSDKSRPPPAGLAPIMHHWAPRKAYAGTHDESWMRERMPLPPLDFDDRHNQIAPSELIYPAYLRGGEEVSLLNLCEQGALRFVLPRLSFFVGGLTEEGLTEYRTALDTLILEPNDLAFELVWRASVPVVGRAHELRAVQVHEREVLA